MTDPTAPTPQDADTTATLSTPSTQHLPAHGSAAWTTWVPASGHQAQPPSSPTVAAPAAQPTSSAPGPASTAQVPAPTAPPAQPAWQPPPRQQVTYLPPPSGPNWGLVVVGLIFGLVGAGVVANQVAGFQVSSVSELGPSVLVIAGLACALLGLVGILTRRRRG
jgi:LPXTG-motif cell wall-anchored protein